MCNIQIYLGVLREAVGVVNDQLPERVAELRIPISATVMAYRGKVAMLMEKYKICYMQDGEKAEVLHSDYQQQRDTLLNGVVNESVNLMGIKEFALHSEKVLELLKTHHTDIFKKKMVQHIRSVELKVCTSAIVFPMIYFSLMQRFMFLQALPIPPMFAGMCSNEQLEDYSAITSASPTNPLGKRKCEDHRVSEASNRVNLITSSTSTDHITNVNFCESTCVTFPFCFCFGFSFHCRLQLPAPVLAQAPLLSLLLLLQKPHPRLLFVLRKVSWCTK